MQTIQPHRICVASSGLGHVLRGIETWAQELGMALAQRGLNILLCKGAGTTNAPFERIIPCWTRHSISTQRLLRWLPKPIGWRLGLGAGYTVEQTTFAWHLIRFLRQQRIDILHVQDPQVALIVQRAARSQLIRTRTILNHGTQEPLEFLTRIDFLQHGAPWHQQVCQQAGVHKPTWTTIPNFVDTDKFYPGTAAELRLEFDIPQTAIVALVASAIKTKHKRIDYLIEEFCRARLQCPDLPLYLVLAGSRTSESDRLLALARERLGDRVRFALDYPQHNMPPLYRMADLFLHGSLMEMMPMALLEAMASGLPCLCHQHPVMRWMVGRGGMVLDLEQEQALSTALILLASKPGLRSELSKLARAECLAQFSRDVVVEQIVQHYAWVHDFGRTPGRCAA